jgi:RNA polymerase sigma factor (TIGR02999 family)
MSEATRILTAVEEGDGEAEKLLPIVYEELRHLAASKLAREPPGQRLQATALVHEAWLRVAGSNHQRWQCRRHFFAAAAEAMRRILIEAARRKKRLKHGAQYQWVDIEEVDIAAPTPDDQLLALNDALMRLAEINERAAELVRLCYFVGLTQEEAAKELGISVSTAERLWAYARAWLFRAINHESRFHPFRIVTDR